MRSASSTAQCYPWSPGPQWFCLCQESQKIVFKQDLPASSTLPTPVHTNYRHSKPFNGKNEPCCLLFLVFLFPDSVPTQTSSLSPPSYVCDKTQIPINISSVCVCVNVYKRSSDAISSQILLCSVLICWPLLRVSHTVNGYYSCLY